MFVVFIFIFNWWVVELCPSWCFKKATFHRSNLKIDVNQKNKEKHDGQTATYFNLLCNYFWPTAWLRLDCWIGLKKKKNKTKKKTQKLLQLLKPNSISVSLKETRSAAEWRTPEWAEKHEGQRGAAGLSLTRVSSRPMSGINSGSNFDNRGIQ